MSRFRTRHNAGGAVMNDNGNLVFTPAISCASTPISAQTFILTEIFEPTQAPAPIFSLVSNLGLLERYKDINM